MGFYQDSKTEEFDVSSQTVEQLDLLRRLSCLAFPRLSKDIMKTVLLVLGLVADRDTGEELFRIMRRLF